MALDVKPKEAKNIEELLNLIVAEKKRIRYALYQPHLVAEMKKNIKNVSDALKHAIDKGAMILHTKAKGIDDLSPEVSKHISILTVSVKIINYGLCECAANTLLNAAIIVFDSVHKLFTFIDQQTNKNKNNDDDDEKSDKNDTKSSDDQVLTTLVGTIWKNLEFLKSVPLDNVTSIGRQIMSTLTVIRDAKKEIKQSIKDLESNGNITKLDVWKYDYSKVQTLKNEAIKEKENPKSDDQKTQQNEEQEDFFDDDDDFFCFGMDETELTELQSLRVYQIFECVQFVDEVINHIYLFIIKHFKENVNDSKAQNQWLTKLVQAIGILPNYVDELSCCMYSPQPPDEDICKNASNLLHFIWSVSIDIGDECIQFKDRKMVIKNKKKKTKTSLTGYEWKCKFIDLNMQIGKMFGLVSMEYVNEYIQKDEKYQKKQTKDKKKKKKNNKKRHKMKKKKKGKKIKGDNNYSASSNKEPESTNPTDTTVQSIESNDHANDHNESASSEEMIEID